MSGLLGTALMLAGALPLLVLVSRYRHDPETIVVAALSLFAALLSVPATLFAFLFQRFIAFRGPHLSPAQAAQHSQRVVVAGALRYLPGEQAFVLHDPQHPEWLVWIDSASLWPGHSDSERSLIEARARELTGEEQVLASGWPRVVLQPTPDQLGVLSGAGYREQPRLLRVEPMGLEPVRLQPAQRPKRVATSSAA